MSQLLPPRALAPILPVRDVAQSLRLYRALGFDARAYGDESAATDPIYGFLAWGAVEAHLARAPDLDPDASTTAVYLYVVDATATLEAWASASGPESRVVRATPTEYGLLEGAFHDPDNNLWRIGSPIS